MHRFLPVTVQFNASVPEQRAIACFPQADSSLRMFDALVALALEKPLRADRDAAAVVRIEKPAIITEREWQVTPNSRKREIRIVEHGREITVRVVEHQ